MIDGEEMPIGKLVLSPTRTYLPVIKGVLAKHGDSIQGMIHNTGGAHTKVLKFCKNPVKIIKDSMPELPPLFRLIKEESGVDMREMYQVFNCGIRLEFYVENSSVVEEIMQISKSFNIDAFIIGRVEESEKLELDVMGNQY